MVVRQGHPAVVVPPPPQLVAHRRIKQGDCSKGKGRGKGKGKSRDKIDELLAAHAFNAGAAAAYEQRHGKTETILMLAVRLFPALSVGEASRDTSMGEVSCGVSGLRASSLLGQRRAPACPPHS